MTESETPGPMRRYGGYAVLGIVVAAVAVLVVWLFAFGADDEEAPVPLALDRPELLGAAGLETGVIDDHAPKVGELAPDFALANARDPERVVRLSDFRGTPVVLNWYASWCGPCRREIPDFQKAYEALDGEVVFLGVNLQEDADRAVGLLEVFVANYPALLDVDGEGANVALPPTDFAETVPESRTTKVYILWDERGAPESRITLTGETTGGEERSLYSMSMVP